MIVYHREVLRTPLRTLEAEIGISRSAVDKFHRQRSHPGKNWPKLRDWYIHMRQIKAREEYQTPSALLVDSAVLMASQLPNSERAHALQAVAETFRALYAKSNMPPAEWVRMLTELAEREGAS
jgi:hypothetical protein